MPQSKLEIVITARDEASRRIRELETSLGGLRAGTRRFQDRLETLRPAFQNMALVGGIAFGTISFGIKQAIDEAKKSEKIAKGFEVIFDKTAVEMNKFLSDFTSKFGIATTTVQDMANRLGFVLKVATELSAEGIADFVKEIIPVGEAMAFMDARIQSGTDAIQFISDAITGNSAVLRRYVPTIREATIENKALELGLIKEGEQVDITARALSIKQLIIEAQSDAVKVLNSAEGDFIDTERRVTEQTFRLKEAIGLALIPAVNDLFVAVTPIIESIADWVKENPELTKTIIIAALAMAGLVAALGILGLAILAITPALIFLTSPITLIVIALALLGVAIFLLIKNWDTLKRFTVDTWEAIKMIVTNKLNEIKTKFTDIWNAISNILKTALNLYIGLIAIFFGLLIPNWEEKLGIVLDIWDSIWGIAETIIKTVSGIIMGIVSGIVGFIISSIQSLIAPWKENWEQLGAIVNTVMASIQTTIENVINFIGGKIDGALSQLSKLRELAAKPIKSVTGFIGSAIQRGAQITGLQEGGIVRRPTVALIGEGGPEAVVPLGRGGFGGITINVTGNTLFSDDIDKLAIQLGDSIIRRLGLQMRI